MEVKHRLKKDPLKTQLSNNSHLQIDSTVTSSHVQGAQNSILNSITESSNEAHTSTSDTSNLVLNLHDDWHPEAYGKFVCRKFF